MADHLYLSYWLRGYSPMTMLRHFGKLLDNFPYSPQNPAQSILRIAAVSAGEVPLLERPFNDPVAPREILAVCQEFHHADCAYSFETWWGLWQQPQREWKLEPGRVTLNCYGPEFADIPFAPASAGADENRGEHLRVEFGLDSAFLPDPEQPESAYYARSNLKGLLRLVHTLDELLPVESRVLWTDSGENFAEKVRVAAAEL